MENNNSCCFVAKINEVKAIEGADNIEQAVIGGWNTIVKKGTHQAGQLVIVATTDAVIPLELSDKFGVTNYLRKGQRVRTVKLRGVYSECLVIPITPGHEVNYSDGQDMMGKLGIVKYEPPIKQIQLASGRKIKWRDNQNFHIYYKFPNLKNVDGMFTEEDMVQITRKIHGTNARYGIVKKGTLTFWDKVKKFLRIADEWTDYEYIYGSHNCEKGSDSQGFYSTDVWKDVANKYDIRSKLWDHVRDTYEPEDLETGVIIYGEIYGQGIQKNYDYGLMDIKFAGFDVEVDGKYERYNSELAHFECMDLPKVELLYRGYWNKETQDKFVYDNFILGTKVPHEGVVVKSVTGDRSKVSKVINPSYLIYGEKNNVGDSH